MRNKGKKSKARLEARIKAYERLIAHPAIKSDAYTKPGSRKK